MNGKLANEKLITREKGLLKIKRRSKKRCMNNEEQKKVLKMSKGETRKIIVQHAHTAYRDIIYKIIYYLRHTVCIESQEHTHTFFKGGSNFFIKEKRNIIRY